MVFGYVSPNWGLYGFYAKTYMWHWVRIIPDLPNRPSLWISKDLQKRTDEIGMLYGFRMRPQDLPTLLSARYRMRSGVSIERSNTGTVFNPVSGHRYRSVRNYPLRNLAESRVKTYH